MSNRLRRGNWSVQELERLRLLLPHRGVEQTAALLRRSIDSVQRKAMDILRVTPRKGAWTDSDDWQLRQAWGAVDLRLLAPMLGRPVEEVRNRAAELRQRLRTGAWSREERRWLKKLYGTRADEDLEVSLMRPRAEIVHAAEELCLAKDKKFQLGKSPAGKSQSHAERKSGQPLSGTAGDGARTRMPRWTSDEVDQLRHLYPNHDNLAVARVLGRSVTSVANKAFQLGIHKSAAVLANIGRANIAHRYQEEDATSAGPDDLIAQPVVPILPSAAAAPAVSDTSPTVSASGARNAVDEVSPLRRQIAGSGGA